jgi:hypothetical protein
MYVVQLSKHAANVLQIPEDDEFEVLYSLQILNLN